MQPGGLKLRVNKGQFEQVAPGGSIQRGSRSGKPWTKDEDKKLVAVKELTEDALGLLSYRLFRPPSEVRMRYAMVHARAKQDAQKRKKEVQRFMQKRREMQKNQ